MAERTAAGWRATFLPRVGEWYPVSLDTRGKTGDTPPAAHGSGGGAHSCKGGGVAGAMPKSPWPCWVDEESNLHYG